MCELKMERNLSIRPWPEPWQYKDWVANLKIELIRVVAPFGGEVMRWLAVVFQLEDHEQPVPDHLLQDPDVFPKLDVMLANELMKCAEKGNATVFFAHQDASGPTPEIRHFSVRPGGTAIHCPVLQEELWSIRLEFRLDGSPEHPEHAWQTVRVHCQVGPLDVPAPESASGRLPPQGVQGKGRE